MFRNMTIQRRLRFSELWNWASRFLISKTDGRTPHRLLSYFNSAGKTIPLTLFPEWTVPSDGLSRMDSSLGWFPRSGRLPFSRTHLNHNHKHIDTKHRFGRPHAKYRLHCRHTLMTDYSPREPQITGSRDSQVQTLSQQAVLSGSASIG